MQNLTVQATLGMYSKAKDSRENKINMIVDLDHRSMTPLGIRALPLGDHVH